MGYSGYRNKSSNNWRKQPPEIPPRECILIRQGRSFTCDTLSLPRSEQCRYCKDVRPHEATRRAEQEKRQDDAYEAMEPELVRKEVESVLQDADLLRAIGFFDK